MDVRGADFVMYPVTNLDRSIAFYRDTLGMNLESKYEEMWVEFAASPTTLALYKPDSPDVPDLPVKFARRLQNTVRCAMSRCIPGSCCVFRVTIHEEPSEDRMPLEVPAAVYSPFSLLLNLRSKIKE